MAVEHDDALLAAGRAVLYPGLALTSLLLLRGPADLPIGDIAIAMGGLLGAVSLAQSTLRVPGALKVAGGLVVVGALIGSIVSSDPAGSLAVGVRLAYTVLVIPWILITLLTERRHVHRAVLWWLAGAALCAAGALVQFVMGDVIPGARITADSRFTGFTTHPSDLGGIAAMCAAAALGGAFSPLPRRRHRLAMVVILAVAVVGLLMSGSVSGLLALCAVVLFLVVGRAIKPGRAVLLGATVSVAAGIAVALLTSAGALGPLQRLLQTTGQTSVNAESNTAGTRLELAYLAIEGIVARPVTGHGLIAEDNILLGAFTVHNNFLAAWHAGGVSLFLGVAIASALGLRYCLRRTWDPLHTTVTAAVVAALAFAQTAPSMLNRYYWLPIAFAIMLGVRTRGALPTAEPALAYGSSASVWGATPRVP